MELPIVIAIVVAALASWRLAQKSKPRTSTEKAADRQLQQILRHYAGGVWLIDEKGFVTMANAELARIIGLSSEDAIGTHYLDYLRCNDGTVPSSSISPTALAGFRNEEFRLCDLSKQLTPVLLTGSKIFDHAGRTRGTLLWVSDLSERKRLTEAVESQKALLESMTESSSLAIAASNRDGAIQYANSTMARYLDRPKQSLLDLTWAETLGAEFTDFVRCDEDVMANNCEGANIVTVERGGAAQIHRFVVSPLKSHSGDIVGTIRMGRNITNDVRDQRNLHIFKQVFNSIQDIVIVVNRDYVVTHTNQLYADYMSLPISEMIDVPIYDLIPREDFERDVKPCIDQCIRDKTSAKVIVRRTYSNGTKDYDARYYPIIRDGETEQVIILSRDLSEYGVIEPDLRPVAMQLQTSLQAS